MKCHFHLTIKYLIRVFVLFVLLFADAGVRASPPVIEWIRPERGISIAVDRNSFVYTIDYEYNYGGDIYLQKTSSTGDSIWTVRFDQAELTRFESATWVETDSKGNILVSGTSNSGYSNPVNAASILMKFSPEGVLLWRRVYENDFDGSYTKKCLIDESDCVYVLGLGDGPAGKTTKIKKFSPDGEAVWIYNDTAGIGAPLNFKFTQDYDIVIAGRGITGSVNGYARIDTSGAEIWSYPGVMSITAGDIAGDSEGNSYVINDNYATSEGSILTKISKMGFPVWDVPAPLAGFRVEVGQDQNPVVSGFPGTGSGGVAMVKWNTGGIELWRNLDADSSRGLLLHAMMKMDSQDNIYLGAGTLFDMAICKVLIDGKSSWTLTMPGNYTRGFVLDPQQNIFVVGGRIAKINQGVTTLISAVTEDHLLLLYPQPADRIFKFKLPHSGIYHIKVYQGNGSMVFSANGFGEEDEELTIDLPFYLTAGLHFLHLRQDGKLFFSKLLLK